MYAFIHNNTVFEISRRNVTQFFTMHPLNDLTVPCEINTNRPTADLYALCFKSYKFPTTISIFYEIITHILHTTYSYLRAYIYARDTYLTADNTRLNIIVNVIKFTYARFGFRHSCSLAAALPPS